MTNHIEGIDHVLIAVRDLDGAEETWRRLGFVLTPRGGHPEWGTANHCIMFERDYVELIGAVGAGDKAEQLKRHLAARGDSVSGIALATADGAAAGEALRAVGVSAGEPRSLSRPLQTPDGVVKPLFSVLDLPPGTIPGANAIVCQHVTPELVRRPEWLDHANGVVAVTSLTIVCDDPEAARPGLEKLFGAGATTATDNTVAVHTGRGLLLLARPDEVTQLHPDEALDEPPAVPAVVAMTLAVFDTERTARHLRSQGVPFSRDNDGTIRVAPEDASGVLLEFTRA